MIASGEDERNAFSHTAQHHKEGFIIVAIVGLKIVSNVSVDEKTMDLVF